MADPTSIIDEIGTAAEQRAISEARADVAAGRLVPHHEVARWLRSWDTPEELPCPGVPPR